MEESRLNNKERTEWINNDEGLYRWKQSERGSMSAFIQRNKAAIDGVIHHEQHKHDGRGGSNCHPGCAFYRGY